MRVESRLTGEVPLSTAADVAADLPPDSTILVSGFGSVGYPKAVPLALAESDRELSLTIVSGGSVGAEIDEALVEADAIERRFPYQSRAPLRRAVNQGTVAFHDRNVSGVGDEVQYGGLVDPDVAIVEAVAAGEDWLIPSTSIGQTPAFVESAEVLIIEINHAQPLELQEVHDIYRPGAPPNREPIPLTTPGERIGDPCIRFDPEKLQAVVETERPDTPYSFRDPNGADREIAQNFRRFIEEELDRSVVFDESLNLQFGVGSLGNALMSEIDAMDAGGRDVVYYGEVFQDGLLDMIESDRIETTSATSLALSEEGQQRFFADIDRYIDSITLRPCDISNNPALIDRFGVVAVNSALEVDLYSNVNSTHINGTRLMNGVGGSGDFNRHGFISVCALPSTVSDGEKSRIVPMILHTDHTEHDIDVLITEQGTADLRGLCPRERADRIIEQCAHPTFRPNLREYLSRSDEGGGHIPHDPEAAVSWDH